MIGEIYSLSRWVKFTEAYPEFAGGGGSECGCKYLVAQKIRKQSGWFLAVSSG